GVLRVGEHAVQAAEDGERQDHILVLAALEGVADQVRDAPEEVDDLTVVNRNTLRYCLSHRVLGLSNVFTHERRRSLAPSEPPASTRPLNALARPLIAMESTLRRQVSCRGTI